MTVHRSRPTGTSNPETRHDQGRRRVPRPSTAAEEFLNAWARQGSPTSTGNQALQAKAVLQRVSRRRTLTVTSLMLLAVVGVVVATGYLITVDLADDVRRVPGVFQALDPATRPEAGRSLTFLLVGTDSRSPQPTTGSDAPAGVDPGSQRSDVLMIARLNPDRTTAAVVSIPRDSWVDIPGHGQNKINAAYAIGGPSLLIETVENLTNIRIDHFAVIDFAGFRAMVDAVGGIDVGIDSPTINGDVIFHAGVNHLDGGQALSYVRQRYGLVGGDLDRAQRQQNALRALIARVADRGMLNSPTGVYNLLDAIAKSVSVDDTLSNGGLRALASSMHSLRPTDITFLRAPVAEFGWEGPQSVVRLDYTRAGELWIAMKNDRVDHYGAANPNDALGTVTR